MTQTDLVENRPDFLNRTKDESVTSVVAEQLPEQLPAESERPDLAKLSQTGLEDELRTGVEAFTLHFAKTLEQADWNGQVLLALKTKIERGDWLPWLKDTEIVPERTAQTWMKIAKGVRDGKINLKSAVEADLTQTKVMKLLAKPKTATKPNGSNTSEERKATQPSKVNGTTKPTLEEPEADPEKVAKEELVETIMALPSDEQIDLVTEVIAGWKSDDMYEFLLAGHRELDDHSLEDFRAEIMRS